MEHAQLVDDFLILDLGLSSVRLKEAHIKFVWSYPRFSMRGTHIYPWALSFSIGSEVFRRRLLLDPDLVGVTHIIFDEVWGPRVGCSFYGIDQLAWILHKMDIAQYLCGYGSIPINTIFRGMNIHLPTILMFTRGTRFWHTAMCSTDSTVVVFESYPAVGVGIEATARVGRSRSVSNQ